MRNGNGVRRSTARWEHLFTLLTGFQRAVEACSRLDAYDDNRWALVKDPRVERAHKTQLAAFNVQLVELEQCLDHEFDLLTSDKLRIDLALKMNAAVA